MPKARTRNSSSESGGYWFDPAAADRAIQFFHRCLTHTKGELAGAPLILDPWEIDIIRTAFGWRRDDGTRKYRQIWIEVPRKNGKSTISAGCALYLFQADGEPGAEVYSAAADREQAAIVFDVAKQMVLQNEQLMSRAKLYKRAMVHTESASSYKVLSADAFTKHGLNASGIVVDEVHAQKNRELIDVLTTSTGSRRQPLEVYITTAGYDRKTIAYEMHDYALKVRDGILEDEAFLPIIYGADPEKDDWRDREVWKRVNPGYGKTIKVEYIEREFKKACAIAAYENTFKRLHLNMWTEQATRWLSIDKTWDPCGEPFDANLLKGCKAWAGIDLSSTTDITALVLVVEGKNQELYVLPFFFVPEENIDVRAKRDRVPYVLWADQDLLIPTQGNVVDYDRIRAKVNELAHQYQILEIAIDRWNSTGLQTDLTNDGFTMVPFGQGVASMSAPTKMLEVVLLQKRLHHAGHKVLRWMASNVTVTQDAAGNLKPDKARSTERIDGIVALIMALGRATIGGGIEPEKEFQLFPL